MKKDKVLFPMNRWKMKRLRKQLKEKNADIYLIIGRSGVGKTYFLHAIFCSQSNVRWFTCENIIDKVIASMSKRNNNEFDVQEEYIVIENMEGMPKSDFIQNYLVSVFHRWQLQGKSVILTLTLDYEKGEIPFEAYDWNRVYIRQKKFNGRNITKNPS